MFPTRVSFNFNEVTELGTVVEELRLVVPDPVVLLFKSIILLPVPLVRSAIHE